jgi:uncharacterized protein (DUF2235 family)
MTLRRWVVCFDGTWNTPDKGANPTNVVKIVRAIRNEADGVSQVTFYDKGVGTGGPLDRIAGGASGAGLTGNMIDGYRFLANNYEHGDEIYVFGFSRGAYTARSLVGFIGLAGLISPLGLGGGLSRAIAIYRDKDLSREQKLEHIATLGLERTEDVPIRCIGVWDTVGALGIPGDLGRRLLGKRFYFQDVQLNDKVQVALHAIAIDEKRSAFAPTLWVRPREAGAVPGQTVEQVWFSGAHSNVGGSYEDAGLSDVALDWMVKRVSRLTGLRFDRRYLETYVKPDAYGKGVESRTALYKDSMLYPYQRLIDQIIPKGKGFGDWFRRKFPALDRRNIPPDGLQAINEMLHVAALERWTRPVVNDCPEDKDCTPSDYRPSNLAAVIRAQQDGRPLPVVGWDGEVLPAGTVAWPPL